MAELAILTALHDLPAPNLPGVEESSKFRAVWVLNTSGDCPAEDVVVLLLELGLEKPDHITLTATPPEIVIYLGYLGYLGLGGGVSQGTPLPALGEVLWEWEGTDSSG